MHSQSQFTGNDNDHASKHHTKKNLCKAVLSSGIGCDNTISMEDTWCSKHYNRFSKLIRGYKSAESKLICDPHYVVNLNQSLNIKTVDMPREFKTTYSAFLLRSKVDELGFMNTDYGHQYRTNTLLRYLHLLNCEMELRNIDQREIEYEAYEYAETNHIISVKTVVRKTTSKKLIRNDKLRYYLDCDKFYWKINYELALARVNVIVQRMDEYLFCTAFSLYYNIYVNEPCAECLKAKDLTITTMELSKIKSKLTTADLSDFSVLHGILCAIEKEYNIDVNVTDLHKQGMYYVNNIYNDDDDVYSYSNSVVPESIAIKQIDKYMKKYMGIICDINSRPKEKPILHGDIQENNLSAAFNMYTGLQSGYPEVKIGYKLLSDMNPDDKMVRLLPDCVSPDFNLNQQRLLMVWVNTPDGEKYIRTFISYIYRYVCSPYRVITISLDQMMLKKDIHFVRYQIEKGVQQSNEHHLCTNVFYTGKIDYVDWEKMERLTDYYYDRLEKLLDDRDKEVQEKKQQETELEKQKQLMYEEQEKQILAQIKKKAK